MPPLRPSARRRHCPASTPTRRPHRPGRCGLRECGLRSVCATGLLLAAVTGLQAQTLTLHYQERPPYSSLGADGQPQGLLVAPLARALARAGIAHQWTSTPSQRQLALIQQGSGLDCGLGWFRTPEREAQGLFSRPIYRNRPFGALLRRDSTSADEVAAADLLADPTRPLLTKTGYSYGAKIDALIKTHPDAVRQTSAESLSMARMILAGRAGWMLISPEESEVLLASLGPDQAQLRLLRLAGNEPGSARHLFCNRRVGAVMMARLDRALAEP